MAAEEGPELLPSFHVGLGRFYKSTARWGVETASSHCQERTPASPIAYAVGNEDLPQCTLVRASRTEAGLHKVTCLEGSSPRTELSASGPDP